MKFSILGFSQQKAVELGLESNDLLVLRWFVDFAGTIKMKTMLIENKVYYWINYQTVLDELPILKVSKQTLYKKHFMNLCKADVLNHKQIKEGGTFSYYCYGINYDKLVYLQDEPSVKNNNPTFKFTNPSVETEQPPTFKCNNPLRSNLPTKDSSIINPSIINPPIKDIDSNLSAIDTYFNEFWLSYPRKISKKNAITAYNKIFKSSFNEIKAKEIIDGLKKAIEFWEVNKTKNEFIPHPATWLNGERWNDETEKSTEFNGGNNGTIKRNSKNDFSEYE